MVTRTRLGVTFMRTLAVLMLRASETPRNGYNKRYRRCTVCSDEKTLPRRTTPKLTLAHWHSFHVGITLQVAVLGTSPNWINAWNALLTPCRLASSAPMECTDHNAALWIPETHEDGCRIWNPWQTTRKVRLSCPYTVTTQSCRSKTQIRPCNHKHREFTTQSWFCTNTRCVQVLRSPNFFLGNGSR